MDTVLIVDDSSFIVEGLISFLKKNYRPLAAYGGAECLEILKHEIPAVIILDIMMEPMDGWETLSRIKEDPRTRHIPVLMFSAKKISVEEAEKHRISIDDFITKPVSPRKIIEAIEKVLARRDTNRLVVERWQAAGIPQEKIEEYLSLTTSLEVDLSLCQNMRIQYDIVPHPENEQEEFRAVMDAVDERIRHERELIESLAREMNRIVEQQVNAPQPVELRIVSEPQDASSPLPVPEPLPLPDESRDTDMPTGGSPSVLPKSHGCPAQTEESSVPSPVDAGTGPVPAIHEVPAEDVPEVPPSMSSDCVETEEDRREPAEPEKSAPAAGGTVPAHRPVDQTAVIMERRVIPAELDLPPDTAAGSSMNGAGTDVPMPWDTGRERRQRSAMPLTEKPDSPKKPEMASHAPGILGRILSFIRSLAGGRG
ncbi:MULTISPECIES: response regulator [unclassified Methanoregula]|uniref:response regulator n=1 Tax=unclassified Methanoregula TaxID=2649730 RepID=UPI0025DC5D00|nr:MULTISPECIES: response regulator [unclassified Methanoregula]